MEAAWKGQSWREDIFVVRKDRAGFGGCMERTELEGGHDCREKDWAGFCGDIRLILRQRIDDLSDFMKYSWAGVSSG